MSICLRLWLKASQSYTQLLNLPPFNWGTQSQRNTATPRPTVLHIFFCGQTASSWNRRRSRRWPLGNHTARGFSPSSVSIRVNPWLKFLLGFVSICPRLRRTPCHSSLPSATASRYLRPIGLRFRFGSHDDLSRPPLRTSVRSARIWLKPLSLWR